MNQRTFLGLTHNPFTPPREGFFGGSDRKTHLDHLRHLSQWSRRILVVTGSFGIGKSSLFKELSGSLEPNTRAARLSGTVVTTEREALVSLLQGFGIAADLNAHAEDLSDLVVRHVDEQHDQSRVCMVMVDDAHLMDAAAISRLVSIVSKSSLRLLLFAEAGLISDLNRVVKGEELEWFEIRLTGFPKAEVREYLEWRFNQAHYRGRLPFTEEQLAKIVDRSSGNPSVVDSMANRLLADMESGDIRQHTSRFPTTHIALVALLAVMVGLFYLVLSDQKFSLFTDSPTQVVNADPQDALSAQKQEQEKELEQGQESAAVGEDTAKDSVWADESPVAEQSSSLQENASQENASQANLIEENPDETSVTVTVQPADNAESVLESAATEQSGNARPQESQEQVQSTSSEVDDTSEQTTASPEVVDSTEQPVSNLPIEIAVEEAAADLSESISTPPVAQVSASDESSDVAVEQFKSAQWLLEQNPERFTMQILTLSSRARAASFIERQNNPQEFALYRLLRDGNALYVITYGVFSGKNSAQQAAGSLEGEMAKLTPWVRPLRAVQDTVRANPQD